MVYLFMELSHRGRSAGGPAARVVGAGPQTVQRAPRKSWEGTEKPAYGGGNGQHRSPGRAARSEISPPALLPIVIPVNVGAAQLDALGGPWADRRHSCRDSSPRSQ